MISTYSCPNCNGSGCANCNSVGYFGRDQNNDYYLGIDPSGNVVVTGIKQQSSNSNLIGRIIFSFFSILFSGLKEPQDFIWAYKRKNKQTS